MKNLLTRTLSGAVFVSLVVGALLYSSDLSGLIFLFFALVCQYEFLRMFNLKGKSPLILAQTAGFIVYTTLFLIASGYLSLKYGLVLVPMVVLLFVVQLYRKDKSSYQQLALIFFSVLYTILPFSAIHFMLNFDLGSSVNNQLVVIVFALIWLNDTGAYLVGSAIGKNRLFERISPKKSWEGTIGGMLFVLAASYVLSIYYDVFSMVEWLFAGVLIVLSATFGDLTESMFKREAGVKDSGNIMPGHGGLLDRFDAALFAIPVILTYMILIN